MDHVLAKELLESVKTLRRAKDHTQMAMQAHALWAHLAGDESQEAYRIRSKMSYELQMASFQQVEELLAQTRAHAEQSIAEAAKGGDVIDRLFAEMTLAGHILPAARRGKEAIKMLTRVCVEAQIILASATDPKEQDRLQRVIMNCFWHRIQLAIEYDGNPADVKTWRDLLLSNPVFQQYKDTTGAQVLAAAETFIGR